MIAHRTLFLAWRVWWCRRDRNPTHSLNDWAIPGNPAGCCGRNGPGNERRSVSAGRTLTLCGADWPV